MSNDVDDEPEEESIELQLHHANSVPTICGVIRFLRDMKFHEKYMGSGVKVTLQKLDGTLLCPQFLVPGEDMQTIKMPILESLVGSLALKRLNRRNDIAEIDKTVASAQQITLSWLIKMGGRYLDSASAQVGFWDERTKSNVLNYNGTTDKWFSIDGMPVPDLYAPKTQDDVRAWLAVFKLLSAFITTATTRATVQRNLAPVYSRDTRNVVWYPFGHPYAALSASMEGWYALVPGPDRNNGAGPVKFVGPFQTETEAITEFNKSK